MKKGKINHFNISAAASRKRSLKGYVCFFMLVLLLCLLGQALPAQEKRIVVYYPEWGIYAGHNMYFPEHIPFSLITHLNYAFIEVVKNGTNNFGLGIIDPWASLEKAYGTWDQTERMGNIRDLKYQRDLKNPGARLIFSIGGWSRCGYFSEMAYTATGRSSFAASCVEFLRTYEYDGIDIDWEYPGVERAPSGNPPGDQGNPVYGTIEEDKANFNALLADVRQALDTAGTQDNKYYSLTIAASCGYDKIDLTEPHIYHQYLDFINIMTYDIHGAWDLVTNHQSALYAHPNDPSPVSPINVKERYNSDFAMRYFRDTYSVPAHKLIMGVPYYSRGWTGVSSTNNGLFMPAGGTPSSGLWDGFVAPYYQTRGWAQGASGFTRYYDDISQVPWLYSSSNGEMWTYEDVSSVENKCDYITNNGFGGIIVWDITGDYPNEAGGTKGYELTQAMYNRLFGGAPPTPVSTQTPGSTPEPTNPPGGDGCVNPVWSSTEIYTGGERVSWNNNEWEAKWWTRGEEPGTTGEWGVWMDLGPCEGASTNPPTAEPTAGPSDPSATPDPTPGPTNPPTPAPTDPPAGAPQWEPYTSYAVGDLVSYSGVTYSCRQSHTSLPGWEPLYVLALWLPQ